jgi:subtilase family serine protease
MQAQRPEVVMKPTAAIALVGALLSLIGGSSAMAQIVQRSGLSFHISACAGPVYGEVARCHAHIVTDSSGRPLRMVTRSAGARPNAAAAVSAGPYWPSQIRAAYGITGSGKANTVVAIVDAYAYPNAASDLATYRAYNGLPALTACSSWPAASASPCLRIVGETGSSPPRGSNAGWDEEQALDLDMVSAMCPRCSILLVEANSASYVDLGTAENTAAALGAISIGNSYGGAEAGTSPYNVAYYVHAGVNITASAGDSGYGVAFPASSPNVIAVGGTSLVYGSGPRSETVWSGSGSGCSAVYPQPVWQNSDNTAMANNTGCARRVMNDVSAVADPDTGVVVYMNIPPYAPGYYIFGGTSASAQIINGIYAEKDVAAPTPPSEPIVYANPFPWGASGVPAVLNDVTSGSNGSCAPTHPYLCNGEVGYNAPGGLGTPIGDSAF